GEDSPMQVFAASDDNTFYVSPDGNDANPGTESAPWASIENSANRLSAGQTLYVRNGIYNESVYITVSGETGNPIHIIAYPGETPVIDGNDYQLPSSDWAAMVKVEGSYINMSGFEVRNTNWMAVVISGNNNVFSSFNVHHNKENGILITGDDDVVENSSVWMNALSNENGSSTRGGWSSGLSAARYPNNAILRNNIVYQNWGEGLSTFEANGTVMEGNTVFNNYSANIYISDSTNVLLQRNFVYGSADSSISKGSRVGIMMGDEKYNPASSNIRILNNIVFGTYKNFYWWQGSQGTGMNNVLIANNTFVNSRSDDNFRINNAAHQDLRILNNVIVQEDSLSIANINGTGITLSNNLWSKTPGSAWLVNDSFIAEPLLERNGSETDPGWYHLASESPAIDRGTNLTEVVEDFDRDSRSGARDIGADEFQGQPVVTEPTSVPTNISTAEPTIAPTVVPTNTPTTVPTSVPTSIPTVVFTPTTVAMTAMPTSQPSSTPTSADVPGDGDDGAETIDNPVDLALGHPAKQSSRKGTTPGVGAAKLAVDGNTDGNFSHNSTTHTKKNYQAWWQVDLGSVQSISTIDVWNRTDCCGSRLQKFYVLVSDVPFKSTNLNKTRNQAGVSAFYVAGQGGRPTTIEVNRTGRYVRVQLTGTNYLSLAEVQVWGAGSEILEPTAYPQTATAISTPVGTTPVPTATPVIPTATPATATAQPTTAPTQSQPLSGAYYVATNGSDGNPGTIDRPWKTLKYASSMVKAGNTLYIRGGIYKEVTSWSTDGTQGAPITIKNYPGEQVVIDGYDTIPAYVGGTWMFMVWGDWYFVSGLEVKRSFDEGAIGVKGANVTIDNCYTHHNWGAGITLMGDYDTAQNNRVWYNGVSNEFGSRSRGGWPAALTCARYPSHCTLKGNTSWENWGEGISTFEAYYTTIEDNVSYNNQQNFYLSDTKYTQMQRNISYCTPGNIVDPYVTQNGILIGDEKQNPASSDNKIINNIIYGCDRNLAIGTNESTNNLIANNTFVNTDGEANILMYSGTCSNCQFMNNLILQEDSRTIAINSGKGWTFSNNLWSRTPSSSVSGIMDIIVDPKLTKSGEAYSGKWYQLQSSSPAIDKGKFVSQVFEDYYSYLRSGSLDIGALEYR
ncbi:MAG: right-handed parallel beta-helix repeat-containing protein, partial [Chloroflexi bacterium]|nr:right-handed parallel beta-helix repeat-containing protein [Chloroflexota bacterium]